MNNESILGCFVSGPTINFDATPAEEIQADEQGALFRSYIWGEKGIDNLFKKLKSQDYGKDMKLILFQFYIKPHPIELENIKEVESYRKKECSIGLSVIINNDNFFNKTEFERYEFLKITILHRLDLLENVVLKKKLDTKIELLRFNVLKLFK